VQAVLLRDSELAPGARTLLARAGFTRAAQHGAHELWLRPG